MDISNPNLKKIVFPETPLKHALVDFAGGKFKPQNGEDFPELIWALAEENFFRGYEQAIRDVHQSSQEKFEE